jgi:hypothetical protein
MITPKLKTYELPPSFPDNEPITTIIPPELYPSITDIITEDDIPVDNLPSAKQQRFLVESLYSSQALLTELPPFLADANVGIFIATRQPPVVPDVFLSFYVQTAEDWWEKRHRSYFVWEMGKVPELVIEIVSNTVGGEDSVKVKQYALMRIPCYVIYDPQRQLGEEPLRFYELTGANYTRSSSCSCLAAFGLGLTLWHGQYEGKVDTWLRWCRINGEIIPTGAERANQEYQRAEQELERAEQERERAKQERERAERERERAERERERAEREHERAERLAAKLRSLGIDTELE